MKRVSIFVFCIVIMCLYATSQTRVLAVNAILQKGDKLCWAASMEMIFRYNDINTPNNQCLIADIMQTQRGVGEIAACIPCSLPCCINCIPDADNCNRSASRNDILSILNIPFNYHYGVVDVPNWTITVNEINFPRPFIGFIGYPTEQGCLTHHAVTVMGYRVRPSDKKKFYLLNDPFPSSARNPCNNVSYKQLAFSNSRRTKTICTYLIEMYGKRNNFSSMSNSNKSKDSIPKKDDALWLGEITKDLSSKELAILLKENKYSSVEKIYYSTENQRYFSTLELTYVDGEKPFTRTTLQKVDNKWITVEIEQTDDELFEIVKLKNDIIISNRPDKLVGKLKIEPFKKLILLPSEKQFYVFNNEQQLFFLPLENIDNQKSLTLKDMLNKYKLGKNFIDLFNNKK